jgi:hypothetical protein
LIDGVLPSSRSIKTLYIQPLGSTTTPGSLLFASRNETPSGVVYARMVVIVKRIKRRKGENSVVSTLCCLMIDISDEIRQVPDQSVPRSLNGYFHMQFSLLSFTIKVKAFGSVTTTQPTYPSPRQIHLTLNTLLISFLQMQNESRR